MTESLLPPTKYPSDRFGNSCWNPARKELLEWLGSKAPSSAELYEAAVNLMYVCPLPGRIRLVAHAVREIRNRLPAAVSGVESDLLSYHNRLNEIERAWSHGVYVSALPSAPAVSGEEAIPDEAVRVDRQIFLLWERLVEDHVASKGRTAESALRLFVGIAPENEGRRDELRPVATAWLSVTRWFESKVHDSGEVGLSFDEMEFQGQFQLFENTLMAAVGHISRPIGELDEILAAANR